MQTRQEHSIQLLPEHLIDQIKAGEIIERPASLIKEILENALDARADKIELHLVNNGLDFIQCRDNGKGMNFEELPMAFCRHATSKIQEFQDLYQLNTFGFRGEALASIASIARLTCTSQPFGELEGGKIEIQGAQILGHHPFQDRHSGTCLTIKNLFYNTPARLKFIRSQVSEKNAIKKIINAFLLANPQVQFSIRWDQQEKELYPRAQEKKERVERVFFPQKEKAQGLIFFEGSYENHHVYGWFGQEGKKGNAGKQHFLFANSRFFYDRQLHRNLLRTLETHWPSGQNGHYFCSLQAPPHLIDINVHPNKTQIKFFKHQLIHGLLHGALKSALEKRRKNKPIQTSENRESRGERDELSCFNWAPQKEELSPSPTKPHSHSSLLDGEDEGEKIIILSHRYYLEKRDHQWFLNDLGAIFTQYLKSILTSPKEESEEEMTPLLIAEPFFLEKQWDELLCEFRPLGFEFERIDLQTVLLKTIPKSLDFFEPAPILKEFFSRIPSPPPSCLKALLEDYLSTPIIPQGLRPTLAVRAAFYQKWGEKTLASYQRPLDDDLLEKLFQDKRE